MDTDFAAGDVGKGVVFRDGANIRWGRIATFISTTSVGFDTSSSLPTSNVTVNDLILLDLGETHNYQAYLDEIYAKTEDDKKKVSADDVKKHLASAVAQYGRDKPFYVKKEVTGNGTKLYVLSAALGSLWVNGYTVIREIEYPSGSVPRNIIRDDNWEIFDDGTAQDGSNLQLQFKQSEPASTETFIVDFALQPSLPEVGTQNFPDTNEIFQNITTLASAYVCLALAAAYAPSQDSNISADIVNYNEKSRKYTQLGREYLKRYFLSVFGSEEGATNQAAFVDVDLDTGISAGGDFIFHERRLRGALKN
jgi:hypothetical protein